MTPPLTPGAARTFEAACRRLRERLKPYHAAGRAPTSLMQTLGTFGRGVPIDLSAAERDALARAIRAAEGLLAHPRPPDDWTTLL